MNYKKEPLLDVNNPYQKLAMEYLSKPQHQYFTANKFQEEKIITTQEYFSFCESQYEILNPLFLKEYEQLIEEQQYFYGCPISLYVETYNKRLEDFLSKYPDAEEIKFLTEEWHKYTGEFLYEITDSIKKKIQYSMDKTLDFLQFRANDLGYKFYLNSEEREKEKEKEKEEEKEEEKEQIKPKDKSLEIPYKITLLNEIGFFDLPKIKNLPKTKQRKIISRLIGGTDRFIEGNISVLNSNSKEDPLRFTAIGKMDEVKQFLSTLNNK